MIDIPLALVIGYMAMYLCLFQHGQEALDTHRSYTDNDVGMGKKRVEGG